MLKGISLAVAAVVAAATVNGCVFRGRGCKALDLKLEPASGMRLSLPKPKARLTSGGKPVPGIPLGFNLKSEKPGFVPFGDTITTDSDGVAVWDMRRDLDDSPHRQEIALEADHYEVHYKEFLDTTYCDVVEDAPFEYNG